MNGGFFAGVSVGSVLGFIGSEAVKLVLKRRVDKADVQRKLIRDDILSLRSTLEPLLADAIDYYTKPSHSGGKVASKIRADLHRFASEWNRVDRHLTELKIESLGMQRLVALRKSITSQLDTARASPLDLGDPAVIQIFSAMSSTRDALSDALFRAA